MGLLCSAQGPSRLSPVPSLLPASPGTGPDGASHSLVHLHWVSSADQENSAGASHPHAVTCLCPCRGQQAPVPRVPFVAGNTEGALRDAQESPGLRLEERTGGQAPRQRGGAQRLGSFTGGPREEPLPSPPSSWPFPLEAGEEFKAHRTRVWVFPLHIHFLNWHPIFGISSALCLVQMGGR